MKVNPDPPTIHETSFEQEIARRCQRGELCARVLLHGDFCGREIATKYKLGLCTWHSEEQLGLGHGAADDEPAIAPNVCTRCHKRPVAFRHTRLCGNCQKVTHRQLVVANHRRETA